MIWYNYHGNLYNLSKVILVHKHNPGKGVYEIILNLREDSEFSFIVECQSEVDMHQQFDTIWSLLEQE